MRINLFFLSMAFALTAFAADPEFDSREAENQFTQATVDAKVIDDACAQIRTDRKNCYQRVSKVTAQCREQLQPQYSDARIANTTIDRDQYIAALNTCVREQAK